MYLGPSILFMSFLLILVDDGDTRNVADPLPELTSGDDNITEIDLLGNTKRIYGKDNTFNFMKALDEASEVVRNVFQMIFHKKRWLGHDWKGTYKLPMKSSQNSYL